MKSVVTILVPVLAGFITVAEPVQSQPRPASRITIPEIRVEVDAICPVTGEEYEILLGCVTQSETVWLLCPGDPEPLINPMTPLIGWLPSSYPVRGTVLGRHTRTVSGWSSSRVVRRASDQGICRPGDMFFNGFCVSATVLMPALERCYSSSSIQVPAPAP
jgi:hypothetical protein